MLDLLVRGGLIVDGSGNPGFYGAVGVDGERVVILRGGLAGVEARRVIDATARVVCPGFIDMHAHSGLVILAEPRHEPKVRQGVTTEVIGVDGCSYAPLGDPADFRRFVQLNSGLDGIPASPDDGPWSSVRQYLERLDGRVAVNLVYLIGNSALRICAVGWENRPPTSGELEQMKQLLRTGMAEGAFGLSTGLDYPPGSYADAAELAVLCREVAKLGGIYHTHVRYGLGDRFLDPFREALAIGRQSGVPTHITHFYQSSTATGGADRMLALVEDARDEGLDVTFDSYPYIYSSTRLLIVVPQWAHDGGPERLAEVLRSGEARDRLRQEIQPRAPSWQHMWITHLTRPEHRAYEGRSVSEVAQMMGKDVVDTICDLLVAEDLGVSYVSAGANAMTLPKFVSHPLSMVGSDGLLIGEHPSPRSYGAFPLILGQYVREEGFLSLPEAVRKMTSFPAQRLGLPDRGLLRDGFKADMVVFDAQTVRAPGTRSQPKQFPVGIEYVIVNGQVVVDQGRHTGTLAGRALRRGRSST